MPDPITTQSFADQESFEELPPRSRRVIRESCFSRCAFAFWECFGDFVDFFHNCCCKSSGNQRRYYTYNAQDNNMWITGEEAIEGSLHRRTSNIDNWSPGILESAGDDVLVGQYHSSRDHDTGGHHDSGSSGDSGKADCGGGGGSEESPRIQESGGHYNSGDHDNGEHQCHHDTGGGGSDSGAADFGGGDSGRDNFGRGARDDVLVGQYHSCGDQDTGGHHDYGSGGDSGKADCGGGGGSVGSPIIRESGGHYNSGDHDNGVHHYHHETSGVVSDSGAADFGGGDNCGWGEIQTNHPIL